MIHQTTHFNPIQRGRKPLLMSCFFLASVSALAQPKSRLLDSQVQTLFTKLVKTIRSYRNYGTTDQTIDSLSTQYFAYVTAGSSGADSVRTTIVRRNLVNFIDVIFEQDSASFYDVRPIDPKSDSIIYSLLDPLTTKLAYAVVKDSKKEFPFLYLLIAPPAVIHADLPRIVSFKLNYSFGKMYFTDIGNDEGAEYFLARKYNE